MKQKINIKNQDPSRFRQSKRNTQVEIDYRLQMEKHFETNAETLSEKMENFPKYVSRQTLARYLALNEIYQLILNVQGDIIEGGVNWGGGLMWFAQLSTIYEPVNFQRRIIGFDTFTGFTGISKEDRIAIEKNSEMIKNGYAADSFADLKNNIELFDKNRLNGHIPKVELVKGDVRKTIPAFVKKNPQQIVSLLHLDFDLYDPTKVALEHFHSKMPKGSVIVFDELNNLNWPGETTAVMETLKINDLKIKRFPYEPHISYAVVGD